MASNNSRRINEFKNQTGYGVIVNTTNGGSTWNLQMQPTDVYALFSVFFVSTSTGWAVSVGGKIINTTNGGSNWNVQSSGYSMLKSVYFVNASIGWVLGNGGTILKTSDSGNSWNLQNSGTSVELRSACFLDASMGYAVGDNGTILKYEDFTGINDKLFPLNNRIAVYPNPFSTSATIKIPEELRIKDAEIKIYDLFGKQIINIVNIKTKKIIIDRKELSNGMYFFMLFNENETIGTGKLIVD